MLDDLLKALYAALKEGNKKDVKKYVNILNSAGVDDYTIYALIDLYDEVEKKRLCSK